MGSFKRQKKQRLQNYQHRPAMTAFTEVREGPVAPSVKSDFQSLSKKEESKNIHDAENIDQIVPQKSAAEDDEPFFPLPSINGLKFGPNLFALAVKEAAKGQ